MNRNRKSGIFRGITRNLFLLGLVSLFTDLSSQMVFPLIPCYLVGSRLGFTNNSNNEEIIASARP